jgi:hypothetical protein
MDAPATARRGPPPFGRRLPGLRRDRGGPRLPGTGWRLPVLPRHGLGAVTTVPIAPSSLLAEVAASALGTDVLPGQPGPVLARVLRADFGRWQTHAARARGCTRPVRLRGHSTTINARTGEVIEAFDTASLPDAVLYKPCGTRRESVCPACAEVYRWDAYHLIAAGLRGGKGVPDTVTAHPATFLTLTPPSFGLVHTRPDRSGQPGTGHRRLGPCRPRRDGPTCPHGRPLSCGVVHGDGDPRTGAPLCLDCYDHPGQVAWNAFVPKLWTRTMGAVKRELARLSRQHGGTPARLRYAKVAEFQARGAVHLHALLRLDGEDPDDPEAVLAPPSWATAELLNRLLIDAAATIAIRTPRHPDRPEGWCIQWGRQVRPLTVARGLPGVGVTEQHVAGYLAKYATKATEAAGHLSTRLAASTVGLYADPAKHTGRLIATAWTLGRPAAGPAWSRLRPWAHMLGFGGHFATKSRAYSTTFGALRAARSTAMRRANASVGSARPEPGPPEDETETVLVVGSWTYAGTGWRTIADAALALAAADAARSRRPATAVA